MTQTAVLNQLYQAFTVSTAQLRLMIESFRRDMVAGLTGKPASLAMLPSGLTKPAGQETGAFLALDFGGTNVRAFLIELQGNGRHALLKRRDAPLVDPAGLYNYAAATATAEELFNFLAAQAAALSESNRDYCLGFTFSFPFKLYDAANAVLLYWTKEIATSGVAGKNVAALLRDALTRQGMDNIRPAAIVNDTVSTLIAAAYRDAAADIGSICGTGHNTCYLEPGALNCHGQPTYLNIESGNFDQAPANAYDRLLDHNSERPGAGRLEKSCSGRYIGELLRLVLLDLSHQGLLPPLPAGGPPPYALNGKDLALLLEDATPDLQGISHWLSEIGGTGGGYPGRAALKTAAALISRRSARLATATYVAILHHIDPGLTRRHVIAIDGSLYEKLPGYAAAIAETLAELLGQSAENVSCRLSKDGSGLGAAVAAATTLGSAAFTPRPL